MKPCQQCGTEMPDDAPEGLCPRCLISAAAKPSDISSEPTRLMPESGAAAPGGSGASGSAIPDIGDAAEVARRLPQFEILSLLGRGGMGVVYKARQLNLDRIVALKILPPGDAMSPDFIERFRREARSLAKLSHPNIVAVHDFGESGGLYYFAMEFVDGANLREMIRTGKMKPEEALAVVPKICDALQFAHEEGVVHRDVKPENILMDKRGRVKIADFGLAKLLRREQADHTLTMTGMTLGTPRYMAPEQLDKPETVDHRADIYSLGVVFYEMLTGEVPMGRFAPPSEKVRIDVRLDEIVLHALERDADRRYQHASQVRDDVERVTSKPNLAQAAPVKQASPPVGPAGILPAVSGTPGGTPAGPTDWKSVPQTAASATFLRSLLWLAVVVGVVMFIWFEKVTYFPKPGIGESTFRIGAVQPWLVIGDRLTSYAPNFLTVSGLAGIGALIALIALFSFRPPKPARAAKPAPSTPQLLAQINARGIEMMIAGLALALSGLIGFIYGMVTAANYAATVTNPADNVASRAAFGALLFIPFFLCGIAAFVSSLGMRKLRFHPFALVMSILLMLALPACVVVNHAPPPQLILFQVAYAFYAGLRAFLLLRRTEVEAAFAAAALKPVFESSQEPRLSPHALWGAILAAQGFLIVPPALGFQMFLQMKHRGPDSWVVVLLSVAALSAVGAVFGSTLLGAIAIAQIKRSGGKLYGLRLAAADALFFPLLAVGALAFWLTNLIAFTIAFNLHKPAPPVPGEAPMRQPFAVIDFVVFDSLVALTVMFFAGRAAWRAISGYKKPDAVPSVTAPAVWMLIGAVASIIMVLFLMSETHPNYVKGQFSAAGMVIRYAVLCAFAVTAAMTIRGALKMLGKEDYAASRQAAICSIFSIAGIITLPAGIWALVRLNRPEVKALFPQHSSEPQPDGQTTPLSPEQPASGRNYWVRIPLGLAGLALLWMALEEILGALVMLAASNWQPPEVSDTIAGTLAGFVCLLTLLLGWRALFCWESGNHEGHEPFVWRSLLFVAAFGMMGLSVMGARALHRDETALRHATERADAVVTKTASGTVLRFEAAGRTVDLPVGGSSAGWGSKVRLCYPPGQPDAARSLGNIQAGRLRNSVFMVVGMLPALVFVIRAARRKTAATKADSSGK